MPAQGIPASQIANVIPGVLAAGGLGLNLVALVLTTSNRVPIGTVQSFPDALSVGDFFGLNSPEYGVAQVYFAGFTGASITPASLLFAQYPSAVQGAYPILFGGPLGDQITLAQLKALAPGTLTIVVNGTSYTSTSINLASATSFSNAASIIQTALGVNDASFTGAIAAATGNFTGAINGNVLTLSAVSAGVAVVGGVLSGAGVAPGTTIQAQLTGPTGGLGTYQVTPGNQSVSSTGITETYGTLTVSAVASGALAVGQTLSGAAPLVVGSNITALGTGTGGLGTYITQSQTVPSETMNAGPLTVVYDSVSAGFILTGGTPGANGTISYASGAMAAPLDLTAATGAVLSQGAPQATPNAFMTTLFAGFQNFGTFFSMWSATIPDAVAFAIWTSEQNTEVAYINWDPAVQNTSPNPITSNAAIIANGASGTIPFYAPINGVLDAAFVAGCIASVDYNQVNGRKTLAFRTQPGLPSEVGNGATAEQLLTNGLNFYGTYSTPSEGFTWIYDGSVTGPFLWVDSYMDAVWLKNLLQNAILQLLGSVGNIPYNAAGYAMIAEALGGGPATNGQNPGPIQQALAFGAIRTGVSLSSTQIVTINNAAGPGVAATITNQGWYLQIQPATPQVRQARGSPPITLWYTDGQSVQQITLQSIEVQ
jgi:Protein of unknown function (DUF3383)